MGRCVLKFLIVNEMTRVLVIESLAIRLLHCFGL